MANKGIYIIKLNNIKKLILIDAKFISNYKLNSSEVRFVHYIISKHCTSSLNDWMIIKFDEASEDLQVTKGTISKWLKKLEQKNILIHEDFRSTLWRFNEDTTTCKIFSNID